jgi:peptide/nickel transport system substrate-binding protein
MTRRPTWLSAAAIGGSIALLAVSTAPVFAQAAPEAPPEGGYTSYPNYGDGVDCEAGTFNGAPYGGQLKSVEAVDDLTVVFNLCNTDPAFLGKIAFAAFGIQDADYLAAHGPDKSIVDNPMGTGPYMLDEWRRGQELIFKANPNYWGEAPLAETHVVRWSSEPGQKVLELQSGTVEGVDNPGPDDIEGIEADPNLVLTPRDSTNVLYLGMNNTFEPFSNEKVRQAISMGVNKQRLVDQFYPAGSSVADYFTPCSFDFACEGEAFPAFDPEAAVTLLAEGLDELGLDAFPETQIHIRDIDRSYIPLTSQVAVDLQDQLAQNLGITATIDERASTPYVDAAQAGQLPGFHLLGWGADYPDPTNFLDYHFGSGATPQFGDGWPDIWEALKAGATSADPAVRGSAYTDVNTLLVQHVPMVPVARGGSATAWQADVEGAHSSPFSDEQFKVIGPGSDDQLVFLQNGEPGGLYCADESDGEALRPCSQINESLYGYEIGGLGTVPSLATECTANESGDIWTCTLREGVTFSDGSTFEAADVVTTFAAGWDAANPLHVGRTGTFTYFPADWGGFLNPPAAAE